MLATRTKPIRRLAVIAFALATLTPAAHAVPAPAAPASARPPASAPVAGARASAAKLQLPRTLTFDFETAADTNAAWPAGWRRGGNAPQASVRLEGEAHGGAHAVRLEMSDSSGYVAIVHDLPESLRAGVAALRLTGWLRTDHAGRAGLWIRVSGTEGLIASDEMASSPVRGDTPWTRYTITVPLAADAQLVAFGALLRGGGTLHVDDLALTLLGRAELAPPSHAALAYATMALDTLERRSLFVDDINWSLLRQRTLEQIAGARTPGDTYDALRYATRAFDPAGRFLSPAEVRMRDSLAAHTRLSTAELTRGKFAWPNYGFVEVGSYARRDVAHAGEIADDVLDALARVDTLNVCAYIVDLRHTSGGDPLPLLAGLGPLFGPGPLGAFVPAHDPRTTWHYRPGECFIVRAPRDTVRVRTRRAIALRGEKLPIAVLVGNETSGAGEALAAAFRGRPQTCLFGQRTSGHASAIRTTRLSDGAELEYTAARFADRTGRASMGTIEPDSSELSVTPPGQTIDPTMQAALNWLAKQAGCQKH
ncbi:MAG TPA: S41 family peptidase [Candidatus Acidoferrales bacterium]|nr:S41 family peptidase [Candidatus Acidoferrales bacterium]